MKKFTIILLSLLVASQAFAFGKNERSALLGFGAGILVSHILNKHSFYDTHYNSRVAYEEEPIYIRPQKMYHKKRYDKVDHRDNRYHSAKHHNKKHNKYYRQHHRKNHGDMASKHCKTDSY